jgi:ribosomal protein L24E
VAVGFYEGSDKATHGLIEMLSNGSWTALKAPVPAAAAGSTDVELLGVSCATPTSCVAVGRATKSSGGALGVIETLADGSWSATSMPVPSDANTTDNVVLSSVSCPSVNHCVTVGSYVDKSNNTNVLIGTRTGSGWTGSTVSLEKLTPAPRPLHLQVLEAVSCPQVGSCVAAGEYEAVTSRGQLFTATLSDGTWSVLPLSLTGVDPPVDPESTALDLSVSAISCPSQGWCVVTGAYDSSPTKARSFFSTLSKGRWTSVTAPLTGVVETSKAYFESLIEDVSCSQVEHCLAVGAYFDDRDRVQTLVETLSGGAWSPTTVTGPEGNQSAGLGISCPMTGPCVAIGIYAHSMEAVLGMAQTFPNPAPGYWEVASDGGVFSAGSAHFYGSMGGTRLNKPVVGIASTSDGGGYWEVASDGGIFSFGDAKFHGSMGNRHLNEPVVGIASTPSGNGYWEVASDGGIFSFGDAKFHGSMGNRHLNEPVVGIAATPDGGGYWEVASDGGIFSFGDAKFHGSMGAHHLNQPVVGIASTPSGAGYWEVASDGGIFNFGDAKFHGSMGGTPLNQPVVGVASTPSGDGYWEVAADGGIFSFGDAPFVGSLGHLVLNKPIVGIGVAG